jgi:hypothetical protein
MKLNMIRKEANGMKQSVKQGEVMSEERRGIA